MAIISKEAEVQEGLAQLYDHLLTTKNKVQKELIKIRVLFENACHEHILNGYQEENSWLTENSNHQMKFIEYDIYCHIIEIIQDFQDLYGQFPEYKDMYLTLQQIMLQFAKEEKYELAAILKLWVDQMKSIIDN